MTAQINMRNFKGMFFPISVVLFGIRCHAAYPLSYRHLQILCFVFEAALLLLNFNFKIYDYNK